MYYIQRLLTSAACSGRAPGPRCDKSRRRPPRGTADHVNRGPAAYLHLLCDLGPGLIAELLLTPVT